LDRGSSEWFYWIREDVPDRLPGSSDPKAYGNPIFPEVDLVRVKEKVARSDFTDLPAPPKAYRAMFTIRRAPIRCIWITGAGWGVG